jgi:hypothetical protein
MKTCLPPRHATPNPSARETVVTGNAAYPHCWWWHALRKARCVVQTPPLFWQKSPPSGKGCLEPPQISFVRVEASLRAVPVVQFVHEHIAHQRIVAWLHLIGWNVEQRSVCFETVVLLTHIIDFLSFHKVQDVAYSVLQPATYS